MEGNRDNHKTFLRNQTLGCLVHPMERAPVDGDVSKLKARPHALCSGAQSGQLLFGATPPDFVHLPCATKS